MLRQQGQPDCIHYPWAMAYSEYNRIVKRENAKMITEALLVRAAIGSVLAGPEHFNDLIARLTDGG